MNLQEAVMLKPPKPWTESGKIPWQDPAFSSRMLAEHLSQDHDLASRRQEVIDRQVSWIHHTLLQDRPSRVLDLGCGPGFYCARLTEHGHRCLGLDFSPASIESARSRAPLAEFVQGDIRALDWQGPHNLAMFLFGEANTFCPDDLRLLLHKAAEALAPGGILLLELTRPETVKKIGERPPTWRRRDSGLFWPGPHLELYEAAWHEEEKAAVEVWTIIPCEGEPEIHSSTTQLWTLGQASALFAECGFVGSTVCESLEGPSRRDEDHFVLAAARR